MRTAFARLRDHGLDLLTFAILAYAVYIFSRPLRDKWAQQRADAAASARANREWSAITRVASSLGGATNEMQVVEIADYECPFCRKTSAAVDSAVAAGVNVSYLDYPLPAHAQARGAAIASLCAASGGRFHEMHARLMNAATWQVDSNWTGEAAAAGVADLNKFQECLDGSEVRRTLALERALADSVGVPGTPIFVSRNAIHRGMASTKELLALARGR